MVVESFYKLTQAEQISRQIEANIKLVSDQLNELYLILKSLGMNFSVIGKDNKYEPATVLSKSYDAMAEAFKQHSLVTAEESETFGRNIKMLFDFSIKEVQGLEELAMKRNEFSDFYKSEKINLQVKKEGAYPSKDLKKWEID